REVLGHCQRVLKAVTELEACAASSAEPSGELRIGISPGLAESVLSTPLDRLRNRFPGLQLRVTSEWTTPLIRKIRDCELDCAMALVTDHHILPDTVGGSLIGSESLAIAAPRNFNLSTKNTRAISIRDLQPCGWILNPVGCGYREALLRAFDRSNASCRVVADVLGYELQLSLVARGAGLGLVPRRLLDRSPVRSKLRLLRVADFKPEVRTMMLRGASLGSLGIAVDYLERQLSTTSSRRHLA